MKSNNSTAKTQSLVLEAILAALLIVMSLTPLGYLKVGPLSITFNMIPVAIGGIVLGPIGGLILGVVFGFTSFFQCFGADAFGAYLLELNPFFTFVTCVVTRALAGFLAGFVNKAISSMKLKSVRFSIVGLCASLLNTAFFVVTMILLFGKNQINDAVGGALDSSKNVIAFIASFVTVNAVWEAVAALILTGAICTALSKAKLIGNFSVKTAK